MKKHKKILLAALAALATAWLVAFAVQESNNAALREEQYLIARPRVHGLYRMRPVKDEHVGYPPPLPGGYFESWWDDVNPGAPKGWQPPGTRTIEDDGTVFDYSEYPGTDGWVRVICVSMPDFRRVTCKAYFLGIFPLRGVRVGYGLFTGSSDSVKAYQNGDAALSHSPVMWMDGYTSRVQTNYLRVDALEVLASAVAKGEDLMFPTKPLFADTPAKDILRFPTKIVFP